MRVETLVQASADVVTVLTLRPGDVYKRLEKQYGGDWKAVFGIVVTVDNNGQDTLISALEFPDPSYGTVPVTTSKVWGTDSDLKLFAADPDEVNGHLASLTETAYRVCQTKETELREAQEKQAALGRLVGRIRGSEIQLTRAETGQRAVEPAHDAEVVGPDAL
jgi:hypothetical protein